MYFENSDQCELSVRYHLTQVQSEAWDKVLSELDALCKLADNPIDWGEERRNLENVLIEVISEVIYDNSDEEPDPDVADMRARAEYENAYVDMAKEHGLFD